MQDCSDVMQLLLKTQTEMQDMPEDDPQVRQQFCCDVTVVCCYFRHVGIILSQHLYRGSVSCFLYLASNSSCLVAGL